MTLAFKLKGKCTDYENCLQLRSTEAVVQLAVVRLAILLLYVNLATAEKLHPVAKAV